MKLNKVTSMILMTAFFACVSPLGAQFGGLKGGGAKSGDSGANAGATAVAATVAMVSFNSAALNVAEALGGYKELAAAREAISKLKTGDAAYKASKTDIETIVTQTKLAQAFIDQKLKENAKLDETQKGKALTAAVEYVTGVLATKQVIEGLQSAAKNPTSLGTNAGAITYAAKELPAVVAGGVDTTTGLLKYLTANGVDTSAAKKLAEGMGK